MVSLSIDADGGARFEAAKKCRAEIQELDEVIGQIVHCRKRDRNLLGKTSCCETENIRAKKRRDLQ